jgi:hypothetical protein
MAEILFISDVYIKKYTQVNGAVDSNLLYPSVYLSQDKYLQPWLGTALYNKLKDDIAGNTLSGDYETLVTEYCQKVVLWWTMVEALPSLVYKLDNGTFQQRSSEDGTGMSDATMKDFIVRYRTNAEYYTGLLFDYLCANSNLFPEYSANTWPQRSPLQRRQPFGYDFSRGLPVNPPQYYGRRIDFIP